MRYVLFLLFCGAVACGVEIPVTGGGAKTDGGVAGGTTPTGPTVAFLVRCPSEDPNCSIDAWWGDSDSPSPMRGQLQLNVDSERCTWGIDVNAQRADGRWYSDVGWLPKLNPASVNGTTVTGVIETDIHGTNLAFKQAQLGCN
ncbi:hypothetical protein HY632_00095 [Candidatus Uhrbacteria bacterium]|nr:hypothetical protein [Candidatus Uhrbacteria bacterium]